MVTPLRTGLFVTALFLVVLLSRWWGRSEQRPLAVDGSPLDHGNFCARSQEQVVEDLIRNYRMDSPVSGRGQLDRFVDDLLDQKGRSAVRESVEISRWSLSRHVEIECKRDYRLIVLTRPLKGETYRAFQAGAERFEVLTFIQTQALCFSALVACWERATHADLTDAVLKELAGLLTAPNGDREGAFTFAKEHFGEEKERTAEQRRFSRMVSTFAQIRPIVALRAGTCSSMVSFSYYQCFDEVLLEKDNPCLTLWPRIKERISRILGLRSNTLKIASDRGRLNGRFRLDVKAPDGVYIQDAAGKAKPTRHSSAKGSWLPDLDRERHYQTFSSVEIAPDHTHCRWNLTNALPLEVESLQLIVRIAETPWGSRRIAAALAVLVAVEVWMVSTSLAAQLPELDGQVDALGWVPFMLAAPAVLLAFYSFSKRAEGFVSGSALISMWISVTISAVTTILYVATIRSPHCSNDPSSLFCQSVDSIFISNPVWLLMTLFSLLACFGSIASALSAQAKYRWLLQSPKKLHHREF